MAIGAQSADVRDRMLGGAIAAPRKMMRGGFDRTTMFARAGPARGAVGRNDVPIPPCSRERKRARLSLRKLVRDREKGGDTQPKGGGKGKGGGTGGSNGGGGGDAAEKLRAGNKRLAAENPD